MSASAKNSDIRSRIEDYRRSCDGGSDTVVLDVTSRALSDRHYLLVAEAAQLAGDRLLYGLESALSAAYTRFLDNPVKRDPHCTAKGAIARALVVLNHQDVGFYLTGIGYRQPEPVWGGSQDTAVDLRISCAVGLAATAYPRALIALVDLLHDLEPHARSGAIRAIACSEPLAAEAVLRSKVLSGDPEPEVIGDCLAGLLQVAADEAIGFVAGFLGDEDPTRSGLAALALGESRLDGALNPLCSHWEAQPFKRDGDRILLRAAVLHRSEAAFDWLYDVVAQGDQASAELVITELGTYRANRLLRDRLDTLVRQRGDEALIACFARVWKK